MSEREQLAQWMIANSFATGHGDSTGDLLSQLTWQVTQLRADLAAAQAQLLNDKGSMVSHRLYGEQRERATKAERELAEAKGRASYRCRDCGARWAVHHAPLCPLGLNAEEALKSTPEG